MAKPSRFKGRVLVVEDDEAVRFGIASGLRVKGHEVIEAGGCADSRRVLATEKLDAVLMDLQLSDGEAFDLLPIFRATDPTLPIYIITGNATIASAVRAVKEGAEDFFTKPVSLSLVQNVVEKAVEKARIRRASERSGERPRFILPSTRSPAMRDLEDQVERLRNADCAVLILGETGTGKSMLAQRIHAIGARREGPFIDVNCAGLTKDFVESELFGHERGAFTGAHAAKAGLLDAAHGGTIFLDEIGDIDIQVQPKVLKVLEQKRFRRMGDVKERCVDVRLVAATHHDLLGAVAQKSFRADLYYRISTVTLTVPPLRERREDILLIAAEMLSRFGDGSPVGLTEAAAAKLLAYPWPGNIRELKNVVERALLLRRDREITEEDLRFDIHPTSLAQPRALPPEPPASASRLLAGDASAATREEVEREHIRLALEAEHGRVEAAARRLGIPRSTLYWKLKNYGMTPSIRRSAPRSEKLHAAAVVNGDESIDVTESGS